jgi:hypothetical protein
MLSNLRVQLGCVVGYILSQAVAWFKGGKLPSYSITKFSPIACIKFQGQAKIIVQYSLKGGL